VHLAIVAELHPGWHIVAANSGMAWQGASNHEQDHLMRMRIEAQTTTRQP
jgi:hypothetical protein